MDWWAVLLLTITLTGVIYGLLEGSPWAGESRLARATPSLVALAAGAALVVRLRRTQHRDPLIRFAFFRHETYALMAWVWSSVSIAIVATYLPLMVFTQSVMQLSAARAGLLVAPMFACTVVVAALAGKLVRRFTAHRTLASGLSLFALGLAGMALRVSEGVEPWAFIPALVVAGVPIGVDVESLGVRPQPTIAEGRPDFWEAWTRDEAAWKASAGLLCGSDRSDVPMVEIVLQHREACFVVAVAMSE